MKFLRNFIFINAIVLLLTIMNVKAETANVTIYYNDINGHEIGKKVSYDKCTVGTVYKKSAPSISGYTYDANSSVSETDCLEGNNILAFVYQTKGNNKEGSVKVSCYDTDGNKLAKCTDGRSGTPGVSYSITPPTISGYELVRIDGKNSGVFPTGSIEVKFIYKNVGASKEEKPIGEPKEETKTETKVETKKEESKTEVKQEEKKQETTTKKEENKAQTTTTKKTETKKTESKVIKTTVTPKKTANTSKKEETKEEVITEEPVKEIQENEENNNQKEEINNKEEEKVVNKQNNTNNSYKDKYAMIGIFSTISVFLFIIKKSLFK